MNEIETVRALDHYVVRARAFKEAAVFLRSIQWSDAAERVDRMHDRELLKFDALWDKYQAGRPSAPVGSV